MSPPVTGFGIKTPPVVLSWEDLELKGTTYFKEGNLEVALSHYMKGMEVLKARYDESMQTSNVESLIQLSEDLSKLYSNISKVNFDIGRSMENEICKKKIETSLQYATMSVEVNPSWDKGYHRMAEAMHMLGDIAKAEKTRIKGDNIRKYDNKLQYEIAKNYVTIWIAAGTATVTFILSKLK